MKIRKGSVVVIKDGWDQSGRVGIALGSPVYVQQWWVPILFRDAEDPDFFKLAGLETLVVRLPAKPEPAALDKEKTK